MSILYFLVPLAIILASVGVGAFFWAVRSGQFDDVETPAIRILIDDPAPVRNPEGTDRISIRAGHEVSDQQT